MKIVRILATAAVLNPYNKWLTNIENIKEYTCMRPGYIKQCHSTKSEPNASGNDDALAKDSEVRHPSCDKLLMWAVFGGMPNWTTSRHQPSRHAAFGRVPKRTSPRLCPSTQTAFGRMLNWTTSRHRPSVASYEDRPHTGYVGCVKPLQQVVDKYWKAERIHLQASKLY